MARMCLSDGDRGIYSTCRSRSSLFEVEGTLSRCNAQDHLSSCGLGTFQFCWMSSSVVWPWASLELWHRPPLKFRRGISSCGGATSGGFLWGGWSLYLWHWGLLTSVQVIAAL